MADPNGDLSENFFFFFHYLSSEKGGSYLGSAILQVAEIPKHLNEFSCTRLPFLMRHWTFHYWVARRWDSYSSTKKGIKKRPIQKESLFSGNGEITSPGCPQNFKQAQ